VEVDAAGEIVRAFAARSVPYTDPHELRFTMRGGVLVDAHLLGYRMDHVDLSALGGPSDTLIAVHVLERQDASGRPMFVWDAGASYSPADWPRSTGFPSDLVHPSAFAIDRGGDYVVSLQAIDEIVNVDGETGRPRWRLGGTRSDFTMLYDSARWIPRPARCAGVGERQSAVPGQSPGRCSVVCARRSNTRLTRRR
jgi:hypothetical protein